MSRKSDSERGISILVGDSCGAGGLSTATALDQLMKRLQAEEGIAYTPLVEDYFDIVAGAGTGAITMTLIGRLGMTTEQAMQCFAQLSNEVFSDEKLIGAPAFKASKMEAALKNIVRGQTGDENELILNEKSTARKCKTMVFARSAHNMNAGIPTIFRSYHSNDNPSPNCTIWQALRAATAHPEMFRSMEIKEHGISQPYVDAAMGCGNPIEHVLAEAKALYPDRRVACIVSIGGGHARTIRIPEPSSLNRVLPTNVIIAMRDIATDNEQMAQTMARRFRGAPNVYFRLNVDQGMQDVRLGDWDRLGEVMAHTRTYMQKVETSELMGQAVKVISEKKGVIPTRYIDGEIQLGTGLQLAGANKCPPPTAVYTERHGPIQQAADCLTSTSKGQRVFVFHGLGGAGKTQLALRMLERTQECWSDVIYVNATSTKTLKSTLEGFAVARSIGETYEDTITWLGTYDTRWLLVFDNADDVSLDLQQYFPKGKHGRVLITTRSREVALLAQGLDSECNVSSMEPEEALRLLLTVAKRSKEALSSEEEAAAMALSQDLGYLALAIVKAGAYIDRNSCGFTQYRGMYSTQPKEIIESSSNIPKDTSRFEKTIYETWGMSYRLLSQRAQRMLWLLAYLQRDKITEEIFQRAATRTKDPKFALTLSETAERSLTDVQNYLKSFLTDGKWNPDIFLAVMTEIALYSLISYDRAGDMYTINVLVQEWIHTVIPYSPEQALAQSSFLLFLSIGYGQTSQDYAYRRAVALHVAKVLRQHTETCRYTAMSFGYIMCESGQYERAKELQKHAIEMRAKFLGDDAEETLLAKENLAHTYHFQGLYSEAEVLRVQILEARKRTLGDEHLSTLNAIHNLALTYFRQRLLEKAETLQVQVLEAMKRLFGDEHLDTLAAMHNLAIIYIFQGLRKQLKNLYKQAKTLQKQVLEVRKRVLGDKHPRTLDTMHSLSNINYMQGLYRKAETLQGQVLEGRKQILGDNHLDTLRSISLLAHIYVGRHLYEQAEALQVQVLEARKKLLGDHHLETLKSMEDLACTYSMRGLHKQAEVLRVQAVETRKRTLSTHDPLTLSSMKSLASTYKCLGSSRRQRREALEAEIADIEPPKPDKLRKLFGVFWL